MIKSTVVYIKTWYHQATRHYLNQWWPILLTYYGSKMEQWADEWKHVSLAYKLKFNSLAPGKFEWNFRLIIFIQILVIDRWGISCETALIWMSLDFTDDRSTLIQVMAWCHQATSYYLSQCWPRSLSPYGVTRPESVNVNKSLPSLFSLYLRRKLCMKIFHFFFKLLNLFAQNFPRGIVFLYL